MTAPWSTALIGNDDLFRDVQATFLNTYRKVVGRNSKLPNVMKLGVSSSKRTERYGYMESPPTIDRWDRGEAIPEDAFRVRAYSVENLNWGKAIGFHEDDVDDLQLGDLRAVGSQLAARAAQLPEEVLFQIMLGTTSARLLKVVPTAPDGANLYSATTGGGANRFGVSGGNIVTGTGVATSKAVRSDFFNALERFRQFQDTEGQPLLDEGALDAGITIIYNVANEEKFREAFLQGRTLDGSAAVSNVILESGLKVTLWSTQRITDNDWFCFLNGEADGPRPVFEQVRQSPRMMEETRENSERARRYKILATLADMRSGFGVNLPYMTVQVNN
jgi:phage major head subunit gpT-like protein